MEIVNSNCCGLDVHKKTLVGCVIVSSPGGVTKKEILTFGTTSKELSRLVEWLNANSVTKVAMESTGSFWKPVWNILEERFALLLVNPQHVKALPGHKTDVKDCEWLADLLRHGLLRGSFVPARKQRELQELTRYRTSLAEERSAEVNRLQKILEGANIKLASVASDITGASGKRILAALVAGSSDTAAMAELAKGRLREKLPQLADALQGSFGPHQAFMVARQLAHIEFLDEAIERVDQEVAKRTAPFEEVIERLDEISGVGRRTAEVVVAEVGIDMSRFPTAGHLASWAGMCPGNHQSAGRRKSGRTNNGNSALQRVLVQAAHAAGRTKNTYLGAQYRRLAARVGVKKAAVAVGHAILVIIYNMIQRGTHYTDLGGNYFDRRDRQAMEVRLVTRLKALGYTVSREPVDLAV